MKSLCLWLIGVSIGSLILFIVLAALINVMDSHEERRIERAPHPTYRTAIYYPVPGTVEF